jgi:RHS repeat-associated protein
MAVSGNGIRQATWHVHVACDLKEQRMSGERKVALARHVSVAALLACATATSFAASAQTYQRTDRIAYSDNRTQWVLGQVASSTNLDTGRVESNTDYDSITALPIHTYAFGKPRQTLAYNADGTLQSVADGNGHVTSLSNWKRGIPRTITYPATPDQPSAVVESFAVDDNGWITAHADENGSDYITGYSYDAMGRIDLVDYPNSDTVAWTSTTQSFAPVATAEYGLPAGHWKQVVSTGNGRKVTYFDALWRPVVQESYDAADPANTRSIVVKRYDVGGHLAFQSYPLRSLGSYTDTTLKGVVTLYDALDRVTQTRQDSELGVLLTSTSYLSGFRTQVTNARGAVATTSFMVYDSPSTDLPASITSPEGEITDITRDPFGTPTALVRHDAGNTISETRSYTYDDFHQLCRTVEPETGATLQGFDGAGNVTWSASGLPASTACDKEGDTAPILARRAVRSYDARNRPLSLTFPDHVGDTTYHYAPDNLVASVTADNGADVVTTSYSYNRRRMLELERMQWNTINWTIDYAFDTNGHLSKQTNPGNLPIYFAPNALGQPTQAGGYATGVTYYPNGAIHQFTYGNGIVHTMTQNLRQLPDTSLDLDGATPVLWDGYDYDANGNVAAISDGLPGARGNRTMSYDDLDRLTDVASPMYGSTGAHYTYDALDNLTRVRSGGTAARDHYYCYDTAWRLTNVKTGGCSGVSVIGLGYDPQGNLSNKNGQAFTFDFGNRLRAVGGSPASAYVYDGLGRRVRDYVGASKYSLYSTSGQLVYSSDGRQHVQSWYVYLGGSLLAIRERDTGTGVVSYKYQHTDALGSPVTVTDANGTVVEHNEYEPFGKVLNHPPEDGPGYTGHVMDAATGMNYMQQRYYDPGIGRFLSVDPVTADGNSGGNFNRYKYAANNPYRFTDPDGRQDSDVQEATAEQAHRQFDGGGTRGTQGGTQAQFGIDGALPGSTHNTTNRGDSGSAGGRHLTQGEANAARSELPGIKTDPMRVKYDSPTDGAATPRNTIHFPSNVSDCTDFSSCHHGAYIGWFVHEATHAWQYQNGVSPVWGHIFSADIFTFGDYLPLKQYLRTASPAGLSTEKQADWHMWHYECGHNLAGGC